MKKQPWWYLAILLALASPHLYAQEKQKRIDWPSVTAATILQLGDAITTTRFLTGHGQSVDHAGPCVEANPHFQPSANQLTYIWSAKLGLIGSLWAVNLLAEQHHNKAMKWISRGVNWEVAALGGYAMGHNLAHCGF